MVHSILHHLYCLIITNQNTSIIFPDLQNGTQVQLQPNIWTQYFKSVIHSLDMHFS